MFSSGRRRINGGGCIGKQCRKKPWSVLGACLQNLKIVHEILKNIYVILKVVYAIHKIVCKIMKIVCEKRLKWKPGSRVFFHHCWQVRVKWTMTEDADYWDKTIKVWRVSSILSLPPGGVHRSWSLISL